MCLIIAIQSGLFYHYYCYSFGVSGFSDETVEFTHLILIFLGIIFNGYTLDFSFLIFIVQFSRYITLVAKRLVGLGGLEPPTSRLSGVRSNHLSYKPSFAKKYFAI